MTTWDPSNISSGIALTGGNLIATKTGSSSAHTRATISQSVGKYYMECATSGTISVTDAWGLGLQNASEAFTNFLGQTSNSLAFFDRGHVYINNSIVATYGTFPTGVNVISMAVNLDASPRLAWFRVGAGNWNNNASADPATNTLGLDISAVTGALYPGNELDISIAGTANFGASAYANSVPSGYGNWLELNKMRIFNM